MASEITRPPPDRPIANIVFNIVLPVLLLHQLSHRFGSHGPTIALIVALIFPLGYGLHDLVRQRRINFFALIGIVNVAITGGLALAALHGMWFVLKDAAFPAILGIAVCISAFTKKPFIRTLFFNDQIIRVDLIQQKLRENNAIEEFDKHLVISTLLLAGSFFLSSALNFVLARRVFTEISADLSAAQQSLILNHQIAKMTWLSAIVILIPSFVFMAGILYHLFSGIKRHTGLTSNDIIVEH